MRIVYVINSGERGGAEKHTLDLAEGMVNKGHDVFIWLEEGPLGADFEEIGASVIKRKIGLDIDPSYILALRKFLKQEKIDVVHAQKLKAAGNAMLAGFLAGTKVRISHTHTPISEWQVSSFKKLLNSRLFYTPLVNMFSTRELALTITRKRTKGDEGIRESKLEIIPNGVKIDDFEVDDLKRLEYRQEILSRYDIPQDAYVFGALGRLSIEKGIPVLLYAFHRFFNSASVDKDKTYLLIAGGGDLKGHLQAKIKELGLVKNVIMPGVPFEEEDKVKFFSAFDCFVFPSLAEGFGLVLIEAMSMSLPIICSDLEVLQEVGGSSVMFFETENPESLSEKMYNLYSKKDRLDNIKHDARERVEKLYTIEIFVNNYETLYFELLGTQV